MLVGLARGLYLWVALTCVVGFVLARMPITMGRDRCLRHLLWLPLLGGAVSIAWLWPDGSADGFALACPPCCHHA